MTENPRRPDEMKFTLDLTSVVVGGVIALALGVVAGF